MATESDTRKSVEIPQMSVPPVPYHGARSGDLRMCQEMDGTRWKKHKKATKNI